MRLWSWIEGHTLGAEVFVPAVVALTVCADYAVRRARPSLIPWISLAVWGMAITVLYFHLGVGRFLAYNHSFWWAQVGDIAVVTLVPIFLALIPFLTTRGLALSPKVRVTLSSALGLAGILCVSPISAMIGRWLIPLIIPAD